MDTTGLLSIVFRTRTVFCCVPRLLDMVFDSRATASAISDSCISIVNVRNLYPGLFYKLNNGFYFVILSRTRTKMKKYVLKVGHPNRTYK